MEENRRSGSQGGIAELRRLWILEEENRKLKQLVADLSLDNKKMLQDVLSKFEAHGAAFSGAGGAGGVPGCLRRPLLGQQAGECVAHLSPRLGCDRPARI